MNKKVLFLSLLAIATLVGCNKKNDNGGEKPNYPQVNKSNKGTGALFDEYLGFNTKDAAVIEEGDTRYIVYASNEDYKGSPVFAARKATKVDGVWSYGEKKIILKGSDSWDLNILNPSMIKGSFAYNGTSYSYLMAYNGNNNNTNTNNHIGLAVTNDILGEWTRVGTTPILSNPEAQEAAYGFGSPSLVSYDLQGKGYLFYSVGEINVSFEAVKTFDFSNLNNIKIETGYASLPVTGLKDNQDVNVIVNAGFALSADKQTVYMVKDRLPQSSNTPNQSVAVEVSKAPISILQSHNVSWESIKIISGFDTMDPSDEESLGWDEIYSGEFVSNPYGYIESSSLEVIYSTYDEESEEVNYSSTLASFTVTENA